MGWRFDFDNANLVAYLASAGRATAPRAEWRSLATLAKGLTAGYDGRYGLTAGANVIATDAKWLSSIQQAAEQSFNAVQRADAREHWEDVFILGPDVVENILDPLRPLFTGYSLYALIVRTGSIYPSRDEEEFFTEAAYSSRHRGLVLMPDGPVGVVNILDPFPALQELARKPIDPPAVVFWTPLGGAVALPLAEAKAFFRNVLLDSLPAGTHAVDATLRQRAAEVETKRFLHMSDLHFGNERSNAARRYIKGHLELFLDDIDRVIVTGDLLDSPVEAFLDQYLDFRADIERMTGKSLIVIPGNHDLRPKGNRIPGLLRQTYEFVVDIGWQPLVIDDDLDCVFFCFNSMGEECFAKGRISDAQLRRMAESYNEEYNRRRRQNGKQLGRYTKVALVHHHPFNYQTASSARYDTFLRRVTRDEDTLVRFEDADRFISWCAERGVSLILHGHKHVPHHIEAAISVGNHESSMLVIGCGSTTGAEGSPLGYDVVGLNPETGRWAVSFYEDASNSGASFRLKELTIDTRKGKSSW